MTKYDIIIAIDPDVDRSGVAFLEVKTMRLETTALPFPELLDYLKQEISNAEKCEVSIILVVEAGWLNKSNWHLKNGDTKRAASAKGNSTGRNHEVGRKIIECARHYGYEVVERRPLRKHWKGRDGKITHEELAYFTGITGRTNPEMRDSALLAWDFAGLPIKTKT